MLQTPGAQQWPTQANAKAKSVRSQAGARVIPRPRNSAHERASLHPMHANLPRHPAAASKDSPIWGVIFNRFSRNELHSKTLPLQFFSFASKLRQRHKTQRFCNIRCFRSSSTTRSPAGPPWPLQSSGMPPPGLLRDEIETTYNRHKADIEQGYGGCGRRLRRGSIKVALSRCARTLGCRAFRLDTAR